MKFSTVLFLSELNEKNKTEITKDILAMSDDKLKNAIKNGEDIIVGEYYKLSEYELA